MNYNEVHNNKSVLLVQCISGSRAYGLDTPESDTDIKGVFVLPDREFFSLEYTPQVASEKNDIVYYELKRFAELLGKNNPNILELLGTGEDSTVHKHPLFELFTPDLFLSRLCYESFAGYAQSQIQKARGLNKKIFNPVDKTKKTILDFCYIIQAHKAIPLSLWLQENKYAQEDCGLVKIPHAKDLYAVFYQKNNGTYKGISSGADANDVSLSSVEEGVKSVAIMSFNKDGYSTYCKDYREYWDWVEKRNDSRYRNTLEHNKNYDAKNMMHTFRLLNMSLEIAEERKINVRRHDREFLFRIKNGEFEYDELMNMADSLLNRVKTAYEKSGLPDTPDINKINELLIHVRTEFYK